MSISGWDDDDDKGWFVISAILSVAIVVVGILAGCEAQGSSPENPVYYQCVDKR